MPISQTDDSLTAVLLSVQPLVVAAASIGSLIVAIVAATFAFRQHRNARETLVQSMRTQWSSLQPAWAQLLLAQHGSDYHYVDADPETRETSRTLYNALRTEDLDPGYGAALELRAHVRPVTRFLSYAADAVIRARWTVSEAYDVLGPDVARHYGTLQLLAHRDNPHSWLEQSTEFNNFDEQDAVFLFAFLLRSEQCRRGDTYPHFISQLARELQVSYRGELDRVIRRLKRVRHRVILPVRVQMLLWRAKHPSLRAVADLPDEWLVPEGELHLFRRPFEGSAALRRRLERARRTAVTEITHRQN